MFCHRLLWLDTVLYVLLGMLKNMAIDM